MTEQLDRIEKRVERIDHFITGGETPERGLLLRVDRLEQTEQRRLWLLRSALAAAFSSMLGAVATWWRSA